MNPQLKVTMTVDDKGSVEFKKFGSLAQTSLQKTELNFKDLNKAMLATSNRLTTITRGLVGLAAGAGGVYAVKSLSDGFMDTAKAFEQMEMKLNGLTHGHGAQTLEQLNAWAMAMPVNTQAAVNSFTMMQAMGLDPTIAKMQTLVDVSAMFGDDTMPRVARALGQMQTLGKLSAEELNQMAEAGINARKYLTDAFHMTVEDIKESGIAIESVIQAIMAGMKEEFGGTAQMAMKTWSGMTTTMTSYWEEFKRLTMDSGPFDALKEYLGEVIGKLDEIRENGKLDEWAAQTARGVLSAISVMISGFDTLYSAIMAFRGAFGATIEWWAKSQIEQAQSIIDAAQKQLGDGPGLFGKLLSDEEEWRVAREKTIQQQETLISKMRVLADAGSNMAADNAKALNEWEAKLDGLQNKLDEIINGTAKGVDDPWGDFGGLGDLLKGLTVTTDRLTDAQKKANKEYKEFQEYLDGLNWIDWVVGLDTMENKLADFREEMTRMGNMDVSPEDDLFGGYADDDMSAAIRRMSDDAQYAKSIIDGLNESLVESGSIIFESSIFGDDANQAIQNVAKTFEKLVGVYDEIIKKEKELAEERSAIDYIEDYDLQTEALQKWKEKEIKLSEDSITAQLSGYRQLFSTTSQLFDENSSAREAMHIAEMAFAAAEIAIAGEKALANAVASISAQGEIPVAGFALVAAMAVMMGALLANIGKSVGGIASGGLPESYGGGSYLTDQSGSWQTDSISDVYDMLEEYDVKQYGALLDIYYEMRELNNNITGLVVSMLKGAGSFTIEGKDFEASKLPDAFQAVFADTFTATTMAMLDPVVTMVTKLVGSWLTDAVGYLFGGDTRYELLTVGMGPKVGKGATTLGDLLGGGDLEWGWYAWLEEITGGGVFSEDDYRRFTEYYDMNEDLAKQLNNVFRGIIKSMVSIAEAFGFTEDQIKTFLMQELNMGTISDLDKMSSDEIGEAFENYFARFADELAETWFGDLIKQYQQVDEGLYETAVRLVMEMAMVQEALVMTGAHVDANVEGWLELSQSLIDAAGSLDDFMEAVQVYFDEFLTDAEQFQYLTESLNKAYAALDITLPETREGFKSLIASIDLTTTEGQQLYVMLLDLAGATDAYYDALEAANQTIIKAQRQLTGTTDTGAISDIADRYGLNASWITESWVEDIINSFTNATPEQIQEYAAAIGVTAEELVDDIMWLAEYFGFLDDSVSDAASSAQYAGWKFADLANSIIDNLAAVQDQIDKTLYLSGGGSESGYYLNLMNQYKTQAESLIGTGDFQGALEALYTGSSYLTSWYNAAVSEATAAAQEAAQAERDSLSGQREILQEQLALAQEFGTLVDQVKDVIQSIKYSDLNVGLPTEKAAEATQEWESLKQAALASGSVDDYQALVSFATTYLEQQQAIHKSDPTYQGIYAAVMADLAQVAAVAEAQSYDEAILAALEAIDDALDNIEVSVDLTAINDTFAAMYAYVESTIDKIRSLDMIISIDWDNWEGGQAEALQMLLALVDEYGWDHEYTLKFLAEVPMDIFSSLSDLANAAGWIANASGGWNSTATISFLKNVATNWGWENIDQILAAIGYVKEAAGSWTAEATISFIATLMDRYDMPINQIDYWLEQMGITDAEISRSVKINLIYEMVSSGSLNLAEVAEYAYNQAWAAWTAAAYDPTAINILRDLEGLAGMWGITDALNLGANVNAYGGYSTDANDWASLWTKHGRDNSGWEYGGIAAGAEDGWWARLHGTELVVSQKASFPATVIPKGGGSDRPIDITLVMELDGEPLDVKIKSISGRESDRIRVKAERRKLGKRSMNL